MRASVLKSTSAMCFNICQAAIVGIVITVKDDKLMCGLPPFAWLVFIAIVSYLLAWRFSISSENKKKAEELATSHSRKHKLRLLRDTKLVVEVEQPSDNT